MPFSDFERLTLINQYEALKQTDPLRGKDYAVLTKALSDGYLKDFEVEVAHLEPEVDDDIRSEVRDILDMFRALTPKSGGPGLIKFGGFDGNEETTHYAYASFLLDDLDRWRESKPAELNSHYPMLPDYRRMLDAWRRTGKTHQLTSEQVQTIVQSANHRMQP